MVNPWAFVKFAKFFWCQSSLRMVTTCLIHWKPIRPYPLSNACTIAFFNVHVACLSRWARFVQRLVLTCSVHVATQEIFWVLAQLMLLVLEDLVPSTVNGLHTIIFLVKILKDWTTIVPQLVYDFQVLYCCLC